MRCGQEVKIPTPVRASDLKRLLDTVCANFDAEVYVREEGDKAVFYLVKHDGSGTGTILASRPLPFFPEEV